MSVGVRDDEAGGVSGMVTGRGRWLKGLLSWLSMLHWNSLRMRDSRTATKSQQQQQQQLQPVNVAATKATTMNYLWQNADSERPLSALLPPPQKSPTISIRFKLQKQQKKNTEEKKVNNQLTQSALSTHTHTHRGKDTGTHTERKFRYTYVKPLILLYKK